MSQIDNARKIVVQFGKRNKICNFINDVRQFMTAYPEEAPGIFKGALNGTLDDVEAKIVKNFDKLLAEHEENKERK